MNPKVLIVEELKGKNDSTALGCFICCEMLGYEYRACHDLAHLTRIMEEFSPDIVFWVNTGSNEFYKLRLQYKNLKVVIASEWESRFPLNVTDPYVDFHLTQVSSIFPEMFQKIITELFITQSNGLTLHHLSDNALRAAVFEKMWPGEKSYMNMLMEYDKQNKLDKDQLKTLEGLIQHRDQLLERKAEAASILINRGYSGSVEELIAESKRLD
ncbi:MAG: hypothetical protein GY797_24880 [Deltaproteobacteria bacterium]|nr:hypothetical protein [Deltaproteobacteria bacterium]